MAHIIRTAVVKGHIGSNDYAVQQLLDCANSYVQVELTRDMQSVPLFLHLTQIELVITVGRWAGTYFLGRHFLTGRFFRSDMLAETAYNSEVPFGSPVVWVYALSLPQDRTARNRFNKHARALKDKLEIYSIRQLLRLR